MDNMIKFKLYQNRGLVHYCSYGVNPFSQGKTANEISLVTSMLVTDVGDELCW